MRYQLVNEFMFNNNTDFFESLKYVILPGKYVEKTYKSEYNAIFQFWQKQWAEEFSKLKDQHNIETTIDATEFSRHEEVTALFYEDQIVAVALTDFLDLNCEVHQKHRTFVHYPESLRPIINQVSATNPIHTFNYLTIDRQFRSQYSIADLILGLALLKTLARKNAVLVGYSRNTRKTNELSYRLGCTPLLQNTIVHGEPSDFMYFNESSIGALSNHPLYEQMILLWNNKIAVHSPQLENFYKNQGTPIQQQQLKGSTHEKNNVELSL